MEKDQKAAWRRLRQEDIRLSGFGGQEEEVAGSEKKGFCCDRNLD